MTRATPSSVSASLSRVCEAGSSHSVSIRLSRISACWSLAALLFYVAGYWPCLHFAVLAGLCEMARYGRWSLGWGCVLAGLGSLLMALGWPGVDLSLVLNAWGGGAVRNLWIALYLLVPVSMATAFVQQPARPLVWWRNVTKQGIAAGLLLPGWAAVWLLFDAPGKSMAQMDYHASRHEYGPVLLAAAKPAALHAASEIRLHRALYHQGRLLEDLFSYTNQTAWELLPSLSRGLDACRPQSETAFELGQINVAEHLAHEALECEGDRPELLRLLRLSIFSKIVRKRRGFFSPRFLKSRSNAPAPKIFCAAWKRMSGCPTTRN